MSDLITDTHALLWYLFEPTHLSAPAFAALSRTVDSGGTIYASVMSIIEVQYLVEKGRLPALYGEDMVIAAHDPNLVLEFLAVDEDVALVMQRIPRNVVPDMPDRVIAATAMSYSLPLVTADRKIRASRIETIW